MAFPQPLRHRSNSGTASRISGDIRHVALEKEDETELDNPGQQQQNKRDDERELDRGHAALTAATRAHNAQRRSHGSEQRRFEGRIEARLHWLSVIIPERSRT